MTTLNHDDAPDQPEASGGLHRRAVLAALGGAALRPGLPGGFLPGGFLMSGGARADAIPPAGLIPFTVWRGGSEIGHHTVSFTRDGNRLTVDVDIELAVSFAFITAYSYSHRNREVWEDGRLVSLDTTTNDDGEEFFVRGRAENGSLIIESSSGTYSAPSTAIPSSYWNRAFLDRDQIINTQDGRYMPVSINSQAEEVIEAGGQTITATRYDIGGLAPLTIWYSPAGQWVKLAFDAQGSEVSYVLQPGDAGASTLVAG